MSIANNRRKKRSNSEANKIKVNSSAIKVVFNVPLIPYLKQKKRHNQN